MRFWLSVWGKDTLDKTEEVVRGPNPIDDSLILPDVVPSHRDVMLKPKNLDKCWSVHCKKILIRPEYKEAEEFVLSTFGAPIMNDALVVTGQPGIGSSIFYSAITGS
jgi:hypothetical protein